MLDINKIISENITNLLGKNGKKQIDLAEYLGVSKQVISKMLGGSRIFSAEELQSIAQYFDIDMKDHMAITNPSLEVNAIKAFMGSVNSVEAKHGLEILDEIADMIVFYANARENLKRLSETWEM